MDGFCQDDRYLYLILEYVSGGELFTYLRSVGRLESPHAWFEIIIFFFFSFINSQIDIFPFIEVSTLPKLLWCSNTCIRKTSSTGKSIKFNKFNFIPISIKYISGIWSQKIFWSMSPVTSNWPILGSRRLLRGEPTPCVVPLNIWRLKFSSTKVFLIFLSIFPFF